MLNDKKKLGMNTADPHGITQRRRLVKKETCQTLVQPSDEDNGLLNRYDDDDADTDFHNFVGNRHQNLFTEYTIVLVHQKQTWGTNKPQCQRDNYLTV